jgi:hypothetical protein
VLEPARHRTTCSHVCRPNWHTERTPDHGPMAASEQFRSIMIMLVACRAVYTFSPRSESRLTVNLELPIQPGTTLRGQHPISNYSRLYLPPPKWGPAPLLYRTLPNSKGMSKYRSCSSFEGRMRAGACAWKWLVMQALL